jgi:hypothetical protein
VVSAIAGIDGRGLSTVTAHIQECHLAVEQLLALLVERALYPDSREDEKGSRPTS